MYTEHYEQANMSDRENGFTLIEVMIAMAIFAVGILAVAGMQLSAIKGNTSSGKMTRAAIIAQTQMEQLAALKYDDALNAVGSHAYAGNPIEGQYNVSWTVTGDSPIQHTKTIDVTVTWQGGQRQVTLTSIKDDIL